MAEEPPDGGYTPKDGRTGGARTKMILISHNNVATDTLRIKVFVCYRNLIVFCGEKLFRSKTPKIIEIL